MLIKSAIRSIRFRSISKEENNRNRQKYRCFCTITVLFILATVNTKILNYAVVLCSPVFAAYVFISLVSIFVVECCENVFHQFFIHANFCSFSGIQYCSSTTLCAVFAAHLPLSLCSHVHLGVFVKTAFMFSYSTKGLFHLFGPNEVSLL